MDTGHSLQNEPEDEQWYRLPSGLPGACGFVRWGACGVLEVELYDPSDSAHAAIGADVATHLAVNTQHLPSLARALSLHTGSSVELDTLPASLAHSFATIEELVGWLQDAPVHTTAQPDLVL